MATGLKTGLTPARNFGSAPENAGITEYTITNEYATALFKGDIVKRGSNGTVEQAAAGDDAIGVFIGCSYTKTDGSPTEAPYWPAAFDSASTPTAKVVDLPSKTFRAKANADVGSVEGGDLYALAIGSGSTQTGQSAALVDVASGTVLIGAAHVKVVKVIDEANRVLEVVIANHAFRDNA